MLKYRAESMDWVLVDGSSKLGEQTDTQVLDI